MSTKPYDQAFKYLAEQDPETLLLLCGAIRPGENVRIERLSQELTVSVKIPDQLYLIERNGVKELAHIESQTVYIQEIPARTLDYYLRAWIKYQLPVISYLLLLTRDGLPENTTNVAQTSVNTGELQITVRYHIIKLWEMEAGVALASNSHLPTA